MALAASSGVSLLSRSKVSSIRIDHIGTVPRFALRKPIPNRQYFALTRTSPGVGCVRDVVHHRLLAPRILAGRDTIVPNKAPSDINRKRFESRVTNMPVSFRLNGAVAIVCANPSGEFDWSGNTTLRNHAAVMTHKNGWSRGRFLHDELFLVRRIVKALGGEVIDASLIVESLREGWTQVLRDHLLADPGAESLGQHLDDLTTGDRLSCVIGARGAELSSKYGLAHALSWPVAGVLNVGDPTLLRFASRRGRTEQSHRSILWERIVGISFSHHAPASENVIASRDRIRERLAKRSQLTTKPILR